MCPHPALPFVVHVDDTDDPADVLDALALGAFVAGDQPWSITRKLERVRADAPLVPEGATTCRSATAAWRTARLAEGDGWTLLSVRWNADRTATLTVTATSDQLARKVLDATADGATDPVPPADDALTVRFWHLGGQGRPHRSARSVAIQPWSDIRPNYATPVADALDALMSLTPETLAGRLLLLHGRPGTGKTTVLRALGHAWREWCGMDYVLDPDRLLHQPGYLSAVALGNDDDDDEKDLPWKLLILEDCDELIRVDAKAGAGQALARLLNLTDGMLGQGLDVLVSITTNEDLSQLHPAVVRPGRCLAQIYFDRLPHRQASAWLESGGSPVPAQGATIAELMAARRTTRPIRHLPARPATGQYL